MPRYHEIIRTPMDLGTIKKRLRRGHPHHYETVEEFLADVQLVFTNCAKYNEVRIYTQVIQSLNGVCA